MNNDNLDFNIPIYFIKDKIKLNNTLKEDLEINDTSNSIYYKLFKPKNKYSKLVSENLYEYYTTNLIFLKDTQYLIKNFKPLKSNIDIDSICKITDELNNETGFYEKYKYINNNYLDFLNYNSYFLHIFTIYNLTGPVLNILIPILMLLIPFFLIKYHNKNVSISEYFRYLKIVIKHHFIGKQLLQYNDVTIEKKIIILATTIFYIFNIIQNCGSCLTYYNNLYKIKDNLVQLKSYIYFTIDSINNLNKYCKSSYKKFIEKNNLVKNILINNYDNLNNLNLNNFNLKDIKNIGKILYNFYNLFKNNTYKKALEYTYNIHGYISNICELNLLLKNKKINTCKFTKKYTYLENAYFSTLVNDLPIKNNICLNSNKIISGPNASGKTTILKSTLFNIILSQQFGLGFYSKCKINPYHYINSYINIPETSNRDSLFQAEARRCKEILDCINLNNKLRHFCIFDELYSGTNPKEAISAAYGYLSYLNSKNIVFMLTTHYIELCEKLDKLDNIDNLKMKVDNNKNYYILENGISKINGGIKILKDLNYNEEIIKTANLSLKN